MTAPKKRAAHGGPRPGAGRPPVGEEPRSLTRQIRCSPSDVALWDRAAADESVTFAEWARAAWDAAAQK